MQIAKVNAMLVATATGFKKTFADAGKDAETFAGKMKGIKSQLGEESGLGNFAKMLKGAGAVAGLTLAGQALESMSAKAIEVRNRFNEGKISAGQMAEELAKSIPIFGSIISAGRNIRELITGEEAAAAAMIRSAELTDQSTTAIRKNLEALQTNAAATTVFVNDIEATIKRMGLTGNGLKLFDIDQGLADKFRAIADSQKGAGSSAATEIQKQIDALIKQKNELSTRPTGGWFWEAQGGDTGLLDAQIRRLRERLALSNDEFQKQSEIQKAEAAKLAVYQKLNLTAQNFAGWMADAGEWIQNQKDKAEELRKTLEAMQPSFAMMGAIGGFVQRGLKSAMDGVLKKPDELQSPQLLQAGSQAAASFVARAQREQSANANDPATVAAKETAENTDKQVGLLEQINSNLSRPVELI